MNRPQLISVWLVRHTPAFIIREPERVFMAFAAILLGISTFTFVLAPNSIKMSLPHWVVLEWGLTFFLGGIAKLMGLYISEKAIWKGARNRARLELRGRALERAGAALIATGATTYALVLSAAGTTAVVTIIIFLAMATANVTRLVVSTAGRAILDIVGGRHDSD